MIKKKINKKVAGRKKIIAVILFCFLSVFSFAQNWQLINPLYKYNYCTVNPLVVSATIWVDSVKNNVSYLNRIIAPCDTCVSAHLADNFYDTAYVLSNQPVFLQRKIIPLSVGIYNLYDKGNLVMHTNYPLNTSWLFDSVNNINAQVISKTPALIFSSTDSVQTIQLSCGDTIILSKNYGILQYPKAYGNHQYYKLVGIEGINKGLQTFKFKDCFNFSVGDILQYTTVDQNYIFTPPSFKQGATKIQILNRIKNTDTISYQVKTTSIDSSWLGGNTPAYTYSTSMDTLTFIDSINHFANLYPNQLVPVAVSPQFSFISTPAINQLQTDIDPNNLSVKRYGVVCPNTTFGAGNYGVASSVDTINPYLYLIRNGVLILGCEAKLGLGITSDVYNDYDRLKTTCLTAYVKGTDTVGILIPDAQPSAIATNKAPSFTLMVFPNPGHDQITFTFSSLYKGEIELYNNAGRQVFSDNVNNRIEYKIDISNFNPGIYLVKCNYNNSLITKKIIIQ